MKTLEEVSLQTLHTVDANSTIQEAIALFNGKRTDALLVENQGAPAGLITKDDVIRKVMARQDPNTVRVGEIMSSPVPSIDIHTSIGKACIFSCEQRIKHLVISKEGTLVGFIPVKILVPENLLLQSMETEEFFNRVGFYGDDLLKKEGIS